MSSERACSITKSLISHTHTDNEDSREQHSGVGKGVRLETGTTDPLNNLGGKSSTHSRRHVLKRGVVSGWSFYLLFSTLVSVKMFVRVNYGDAKHLARSKKVFENRSKNRFSDHLV